MKTKIVYVVTSDNKDLYLEQTFLSILSLRKYNTECEVALVVDSITNETLLGERKKIESVIDEKIIVNIDAESKHQRSRILKTSLRNHINGDYLFIDSDTIICDSLAEIDNFEGEICAVLDKHYTLPSHKMYDSLEEWGKKVEWNLRLSPFYFNSGVMYVKDTPNTHKFYDCWNKVWCEGTKKGLGLDQPSLAKTNQVFNNIITEIPGIWNCQILENGLCYLAKAKIIHYFASNLGQRQRKYAYMFANKNLYSNIFQQYPNDATVNRLLEEPRKAFCKDTMIITGDDIDVMKTTSFSCLRRMYGSYPKIFRFIEVVIQRLFGIK